MQEATTRGSQMPPEMRQELADYRDACAKQLEELTRPNVVVLPDDLAQLRELIRLLDEVLALDAQND